VDSIDIVTTVVVLRMSTTLAGEQRSLENQAQQKARSISKKIR